ncbi:MAG TPA: hypothetical protein DCS93_02165 [Microscillaceae bacterium]|nr:hypothetical protein [Microscillaceae bacterium]
MENIDKQKLLGTWEKATTLRRLKMLSTWTQKADFFTSVIDLKAKRKKFGKQLRTDFPKNIGQIKGIKMLDMSHQDLKQIPTAVFDISGLEVLNLENTQLNNLPNKVLNLSQLKVLVLGKNPGLKFIPDIGQLAELEEIDLSDTSIQSLPDSFFELKKIQKIVLTQSVLSQDTDLITRLSTTFPAAAIITTASSGQTKSASIYPSVIRKEMLSEIDAETLETQVKFNRKKINLRLINETNTWDDTITWTNTLLKDFEQYEQQALQALLDAHVSLEKGQKLKLVLVEVSEKTKACFAYSFIEKSGMPGHTFFVNTYDGGHSFAS